MANIVYNPGKIGLLNGLRDAIYENVTYGFVELVRNDGTAIAGFDFEVQIQFNAATTSVVALTLDGNPEFDVLSAPVTVDRIRVYNFFDGDYVQIMLNNSVTFNNPGKFTLSSCTITI
jgi:hypothetical protein